jgi:hypothetical protein
VDLLTKQQYFVGLLSMLIQYAATRGYKFTLGFGYREPGPHARFPGDTHPIVKSCHEMRLAQDLNLFLDGTEYISMDEGKMTAEMLHRGHEAFADLGTYWKNLDPMCRWGGDFAIRDWNHFSITHEGIS